MSDASLPLAAEAALDRPPTPVLPPADHVGPSTVHPSLQTQTHLPTPDPEPAAVDQTAVYSFPPSLLNAPQVSQESLVPLSEPVVVSAAAGSPTLDSLEQLKLFKAQVEATRHRASPVDPAKAAESFLAKLSSGSPLSRAHAGASAGGPASGAQAYDAYRALDAASDMAQADEREARLREALRKRSSVDGSVAADVKRPRGDEREYARDMTIRYDERPPRGHGEHAHAHYTHGSRHEYVPRHEQPRYAHGNGHEHRHPHHAHPYEPTSYAQRRDEPAPLPPLARQAKPPPPSQDLRDRIGLPVDRREPDDRRYENGYRPTETYRPDREAAPPAPSAAHRASSAPAPQEDARDPRGEYERRPAAPQDREQAYRRSPETEPYERRHHHGHGEYRGRGRGRGRGGHAYHDSRDPYSRHDSANDNRAPELSDRLPPREDYRDRAPPPAPALPPAQVVGTIQALKAQLAQLEAMVQPAAAAAAPHRPAPAYPREPAPRDRDYRDRVSSDRDYRDYPRSEYRPEARYEREARAAPASVPAPAPAPAPRSYASSSYDYDRRPAYQPEYRALPAAEYRPREAYRVPSAPERAEYRQDYPRADPLAPRAPAREYERQRSYSPAKEYRAPPPPQGYEERPAYPGAEHYDYRGRERGRGRGRGDYGHGDFGRGRGRQ
ncbi:hypothetical protein Q5752_000695 [Cryptotrichosporon argae]